MYRVGVGMVHCMYIRGVRRNWLRGGCGKSQTALLLKIFLGTGQPQGLLYHIHWEAQPQAKPINRYDFQVNIIIEVYAHNCNYLSVVAYQVR